MTDQFQQICAGFETFPPASAEACADLRERFSGFTLNQYVGLLLHTNGLGEVFAENGLRVVHNMLIVPIDEAIKESEREFGGGAFVIGRPAVDGILFVLKPGEPSIYAYHPIDCKFSELAESLHEFLRAWTLGTVRI
jgi:hypothetical protein